MAIVFTILVCMVIGISFLSYIGVLKIERVPKEALGDTVVSTSKSIPSTPSYEGPTLHEDAIKRISGRIETL